VNKLRRALAAAVTGSVLAAAAMVSDAKTESSETQAPATNLQVLPASISPSGLKSLMKQYERELGVSCSYCHVEDRESSVIDYASDENPRKHTARIMIAMLEDINSKHLAQLAGDRRYSEPVSCGSCHRGRANPQAFSP
jgi:hypothetical protein